MLITGRARLDPESESAAIQILLTAPDDDSAVRRALDALRQRGNPNAVASEIDT